MTEENNNQAVITAVKQPEVAARDGGVRGNRSYNKPNTPTLAALAESVNALLVEVNAMKAANKELSDMVSELKATNEKLATDLSNIQKTSTGGSTAVTEPVTTPAEVTKPAVKPAGCGVFNTSNNSSTK